MSKKKQHDDDAQHFTCEHCGHDWRIGKDALPISPHCPSCGNVVQAVAEPLRWYEEPVAVESNAVEAPEPVEDRHYANRVLTASGTACADCGAEEGHKEVVDGITGAARRCAYADTD